MHHRVTVAITSFNQEAFIEESVSSALAQTVPVDVMVVDDGSDDRSVELARRLGARVVDLPHRGALWNFRAAVEQVETDFYSLLNADDALEPTFVERTLDAMSDPRVGFVYTGWREIGSGKRMERAQPFDPSLLRFGNYVHAASLVRRSAYESVDGYDPRFCDYFEDWALWVALVDAGWLGRAIDEPLLRYRRHVGPSRNPDSRWSFDRARWRLARLHPRMYGLSERARLALDTSKLAVRTVVPGLGAKVRR